MYKVEIIKLGVTKDQCIEYNLEEHLTREKALSAADEFISKRKQKYVNPNAVRNDKSFIRRTNPNRMLHNQYEIYPVFGWNTNIASMLVKVYNPEKEWRKV